MMLYRLFLSFILCVGVYCNVCGQEVDASGIKITPTFCGDQKGEITGITGPANFTYRWLNAAGNLQASELDLKNVRAGSYRLFYTNPATAETKSFGPVTIQNSTEIIDKTNVIITPSGCGANNGSITNLTFKGNITTCIWSKIGESATFVSDDTDLIGAGAGLYSVTATNSNGCKANLQFTLPENSDIVISHTNALVTNAQCGANNGAIKNVTATSAYPLKYSWRNQDNQQVATSANLINQPSGLYTLYVTGGVTGNCVSTYGPQIIGSVGGLTIDSSQIVKVADNCTKKGASITGINVVGTGLITYTWYHFTDDQLPKVVGQDKDLRNVTGGRYMLQVTDQSGCGPVFSNMYQLMPYTGLKFYPELVKVSVASCDSYASITGVSAQQNLTGLLKYEWRKPPNLDLVSTQPDLIGLPGGKYFLFVRDVCGGITSLQYSFDMGDNLTTFNGVYRYTLKNSCVAQNTGSITIDAYPPGIQKLRWVNAAGDNFATGPSLEKLGPGNYTLYVTDEIGCERFYDTFPIVAAAPVQIVENSGNLNADTCNTSTGSITDIQFVNGYPPFVYTWRDKTGKVISQTANAYNLRAGEYTLSLSDGTGCDGPSKTFTLGNVDINPAAPLVNDIYICSGGEAIFRVTSPKPGSRYRVYESANSLNPIDEQSSGEFKLKVFEDKEFYVSRIRGDCEGTRTKMAVTIGLFITDLTNAFTPNGDGINDIWLIKNIDKYTDALIQVYSRAGQQVYQSRGYAKPFNGTYNGRQLPMGVYYYVITLDNGCKVSGNVSLLR